MGNHRILKDASQWYVIASDGDMMVRVRPGMPLGETAAGNLSFDPACAQLALEIAEDGDLDIHAAPSHQLMVDDSPPSRRQRLSRHSRIEIRLSNNVLQLDTNFVEQAEVDATIEVHALADEPEQIEGRPRAPAPVRDIASSRREPVNRAEAQTDRKPPSTIARRRKTASETAQVPRSGLLDDAGRAPAPAPTRAKGNAASATAQAIRPMRAAPMPARRRGHGPLIAACIGLACLAIALTYLLLNEPQIGTSLADLAQPAETQEGQRPAPATQNPSEPVVSTSPPSEARQLPPTVPQPVLLPPPAQPSSDQRGSAMAGTAQAPSPPRDAEPAPTIAEPTTTLIEAVPIPSTQRRLLPEPVAAEPEPTVRQSTAPSLQEVQPAPANPALVAVLEEIGEAASSQARDMALQQDLRAAELALVQGRLASPPEENALALYQSVLERDPGSNSARSGLQSVQQALINQALAQIAGDALAEAQDSLEAAEKAGASPLLVADLRGEIEYRQRLLDARPGRLDELYPIDQLVAINRPPPRVLELPPRLDGMSVDVEFTVTTAGDVQDVVVSDNPPATLEQAARAAVADWQFEPVLLDGRPIPVRSSVRFTFRN